MLSFIFLNSFFRRRADGSPCLPPRASNLDHIRLWKDVEPPEAHDASYADALCDAHARRLLQSEFANIKLSAPADIYKRVLVAIEETEAPSPVPVATRPTLKPASRLSALFTQLYKTFSGPATARIVPSGVALLLALSILTPNVTRMLRGEPASRPATLSRVISVPSEPQPTAGEGFASWQHNPPEGRSVSPALVTGAAVAEDPAIDENRLSRGLPPLKQALRLQTPQDRYEYINQRFAPE